jgi:hypothetical protein
MRVDRHQLNRVLYGHPEKAEGLNAASTTDQLKQVNDIADEQAALSYTKDMDRANVASLESELPETKDILGQVDDALKKKELSMEDLPGDDKMNLATLKALRDEIQVIVDEYNSEGKNSARGKDTIRRRQNTLLTTRGIPTLERIGALVQLLESTSAKDLAHQQMGVICLETKAIFNSARTRKINKAFDRLAMEVRSGIYNIAAPAQVPAQAPAPAAPPQAVGAVQVPSPSPGRVEGKSPLPTPQKANGIDIAQILDYKEVVKHPKFQNLNKRTTQELKEEISKLLTSAKHAKKDGSRLQKVIMIISILKQRGSLNTHKLAKLMTHSNERFAQQL